MKKVLRILAVAGILAFTLAGVFIPSTPAYADIAGAPDYYRLDYTVTAGGMDAYEVYYDGSYTTNADYLFILANDYEETPLNDCNSGIIFPSVEVPNASEAQVLEAYIAIYSNGEGLRDLVTYIYGEDSADPQLYVSGFEPSVSIRNRTTAFRYVDADTSATSYWYIDVTPIVEELIASPNWSQGGNMSFLFMHDDEYSTYAFAGGSYETGEGTMPTLTIYYAPITETHYIVPFGHSEDIYAGVTENISFDDSCDSYHLTNAMPNDYIYFGFNYSDVYYVGTANWHMMPYAIARTIIGFDTSVLPDDATVVNATIFLSWQAHASITDNSSVIITGYDDKSALPVIDQSGSPYFNRSLFTGAFASFDTADFQQIAYLLPPIPRTEVVFKEALADFGSYINVSGYTIFGMRDLLDINDVCPDGITSNGSVETVGLQWSYYDWFNEPYPPAWLAIDVESLSPTPTPTITPAPPLVENDSAIAMMTITAIIFTSGGVLGVLGLIVRGDAFSSGLRVGLFITLSIMTIIGAVILESVITTIT